MKSPEQKAAEREERKTKRREDKAREKAVMEQDNLQIVYEKCKSKLVELSGLCFLLIYLTLIQYQPLQIYCKLLRPTQGVMRDLNFEVTYFK